MTTTINASNSGSGGLIQTADASGVLALQTAGTTAVTIDASQNVGIGATVNNVFDAVAAARPLVVQKSDTSTTLNGSTAAITIVNGATTTSNTAQLNFAAITGASTSQYSSAIISTIFGARTNGQYPTGILTFSTSSTINAAPSEKVRIGSAGEIGIGGANYGTSGQVLTSGGSGAAPSWATAGGYGVGQTLTNYSSSGRAMDTTYTNSTGKPISVMFTPNASANLFAYAVIDGNNVEFQQFTPSGGGGCAAFFIMVPNGSTYRMTNAGNASIAYWYEWR